MLEIVGLLKFFKEGKEVTVFIDKPEFMVGRALESDIHLANDSRVSRKHCRIFGEDGVFFIEDLGSSNGTFVNGKRIRYTTRLENDDVLKIGGTKCIFVTDRRQEADTAKIKSEVVLFCAKCKGSIKRSELDKAFAEKDGEEYICPECSKKLNLKQKVFMNYEILDKISQGGCGVVYQARHRIMDTIVAIKLIREGKDADQDIMKRFIREIRLGSMIKHPNIIEFLDAGDYKGVKYLVMEFCDGPSLHDKLKGGGRIFGDQFENIAFQLFDAIEALHKADLVHRDIKPENVLLLQGDIVKLIDFGLAKSLDPQSFSILTQSGEMMGTPHYMPPEQVQDTRRVDYRADVYSLGATFYRMLTGDYPVKSASMADFVKNITARKIAHPSEVNKEISKETGDWLMKSMELDPDDRYQSIEEFKEAYLRIE
jgi:hypothetical protein